MKCYSFYGFDSGFISMIKTLYSEVENVLKYMVTYALFLECTRVSDKVVHCRECDIL